MLWLSLFSSSQVPDFPIYTGARKCGVFGSSIPITGFPSIFPRCERLLAELELRRRANGRPSAGPGPPVDRQSRRPAHKAVRHVATARFAPAHGRFLRRGRLSAAANLRPKSRARAGVCPSVGVGGECQTANRDCRRAAVGCQAHGSHARRRPTLPPAAWSRGVAGYATRSSRGNRGSIR